jgi:hypothetical protein
VTLFALSEACLVGIVAGLLCLGGGGIVAVAFVAFARARETRAKIEGAVGRVTSALTGEANAELVSAPDYVRALAELAEKLAKVSPPVAALLIATLPFFFAAALVSIYVLQ